MQGVGKGGFRGAHDQPAEVQATPASLGYRMPAEWEPHAATWLSWPHKRASWPGKFEPVPAVWAQLARTISRFERVHVLASGPPLEEARRLLAGAGNIELHDVPTNDAWMRDYGPTFLVGPPGAPSALVDWEFNAWGTKYPPYDLDDQVPAQIARITGCRRFIARMVLEGGAIEVNGRGTLLTTESCLLNPNRNPDKSRVEVETVLRDYLGVRQVLWLGGWMAGDDTDGHIDQLARFVDERTVLAAVEEDPRDENYEPLRDNYRRLQTMTDQDGRPLHVERLPMPRGVYYQGQRLPASYANFYLCNGAVIVPQFDDPQDEYVLRLLKEVMPGRQIIGQYAVDLVLGLGAFHCITQQQPGG